MIVDVTDATFEAEVLQRSMSTPVVVDLWAPWCGPCKTLGPILERVVNAAEGKVVLAKINVDENPQSSAAFQVQSIPAVYALSQGQVVGNFMGAQPEDQIREFVNGLVGGASEAEVAALVAAGDEASLRRAVELAPDNKPAIVLLAQLCISSDRMAEAVSVLEAGIASDAKLADDEHVAPMLEMARQAVLPGEARTQIEVTLAELLPTVRGDDDARAKFVSLLDELSVGDPAGAADWRKKLSTQLF